MNFYQYNLADMIFKPAGLILLMSLLSACSSEENTTVTETQTAAPEVKTDTSNFKLTKIAEGIYLHKGLHVSFEHEHHDDVANIGFIEGENCLAVIDTSGSVSIAKEFKQAIRAITDKPVCYVINSHVHFDHVLGNAIFRETDVEFVGHVALFGEIDANRDFFTTEFKEELGEFSKAEDIIAPGILVEDSMELDLGNRIIQLTAHPGAHSNTDLSIYDKQTDTLWLSDLLFVERIPALDGSLKGWLAVLETILTKDYARIVPGHGPVVESKEAILAHKHYLTVLLEQTRAAIEEGMFMEEVVEEVGKEEKLKWLLHEQHHKRNVTKAFSELEWE